MAEALTAVGERFRKAARQLIPADCRGTKEEHK